MTPFELFPHAHPLGVNGGDPRLDFRAFVQCFSLVYIDHVDFPNTVGGMVGQVRYFTRRYANNMRPVTEASITLLVYSDASFGVYAKIPGESDSFYGALARLGFDQKEIKKVA